MGKEKLVYLLDLDEKDVILVYDKNKKEDR